MPKFKPQLVTNLHGDCFSQWKYGTRVESHYSVGFNYDGARYHLWFTNGKDEEILYKNPPLGMDVHHPDHYQPRKLALSAAFGLSVLAWLEPQLPALKAQAKAEFDEKQTYEQAAANKRASDARIANAAPDMLAALLDVRDKLVGHAELQAVMRAAIVKAIGE